LQRILNQIGILVLDHVIVAGQSAYSMSAHGDLDFRSRTL
jgi:DNA repair protein RadC